MQQITVKNVISYNKNTQLNQLLECLFENIFFLFLDIEDKKTTKNYQFKFQILIFISIFPYFNQL